LAHLMLTDFGVRLGASDNEFGFDEDLTVAGIVDLVGQQCATVPGFGIGERVVVGNFSYAKLPMVLDLESSEASIQGHDLPSAIAGNDEARLAIREKQKLPDEMHIPVVPPPADEYLVLDADSSQSMVIASGISKADLVVVGPPGTGKSQTIANLI